jgi:hypothetical protein
MTKKSKERLAMTRFTSKRALAIVLAAAVIAPSAAIAQSSNEGYGGPNNVVAGIDDTTPPTGGGGDNVAGQADNDVAGTTVDSADAGTLPFTGADLGVLTAAGLILLALGLGLRRLTQRPSGA